MTMTPEHRKARAKKMERLRSGGRLRTLELCSGCGGLSLGLKTAGFDLTAHIEVDPEAAASYALNFGKGRLPSDPWVRPRDMEAYSAEQLTRDLGFATGAVDTFDVLAAGLPCQAFARIGRSKLREIAGDEDAFRNDPRAALYRRFLKFVNDVQPLAIVIENVPDILNFGGHNVSDEICEALEESGYRAAYTILNAAHYGVPQVRERLFIIALAEQLQLDPRFPDPTHFLKLPRGYEGSRRVALKHVDEKNGHFHPIHEPSPALGGAPTTRDALADLPRINEHKSNPSKMRKRSLSDVLPYCAPLAGISEYAKLMRTWEGLATKDGADGHLVRLTPRDFPIFGKMKQGADYPEARRIAEQMFSDALKHMKMTRLHKNSKAYRELREDIVPPYDPEKFPNKWWKLNPDKPSRTLTAHIGKDTYSHIHYDGRQSRCISVREAARLQSFPDGFQFAGAMNAAFRQIGNAVPPLLGLAVARSIKSQIELALDALLEVGRNRAA